MTTLAVLTCARGDDPWASITRTLEQLDRENLPDVAKYIVCDGTYEGPQPPGWRVVHFHRPPGALHGNKLAFWHLLEQALPGEDLVALEDDIELCKNAARRMVTFPVPVDLAWVQFCSPHLLEAKAQVGLWRPPRCSSAFLQAAKFRGAALDAIIRFRHVPLFQQYTASDQALSLAALACDLAYGAHCPDLVQHAGEHSAVDDGQPLADWRRARSWPGPAFDAMKLFAVDDRFR